MKNALEMRQLPPQKFMVLIKIAYFLHLSQFMCFEICGFYIQWSKLVQHATTSNERNQRPKYLQNYDEKLDMGKHDFILVITI